MIEKKVIIILPTKEEYADICSNFFELLCKNWPECSFQIAVAWIGGGGNNTYSVIKNRCLIHRKIHFIECQGMSLPEAVKYVSDCYKAEYCICMLGDALIYQKVNDMEIRQMVKKIMDDEIEYCNLIPKPKVWLRRYYDYDERARFINFHDRYAHSFIAFLASKKFIEKEFADRVTDLEFERKYLNIVNSAKKGIYRDRIIMKKNIFHIVHGIEKGKWNRRAYTLIKKNNPQIVLAKRERTGIIKSIVFGMASKVRDRLPSPIRRRIKKIIMIFYKKFTTEL